MRVKRFKACLPSGAVKADEVPLLEGVGYGAGEGDGARHLRDLHRPAPHHAVGLRIQYQGVWFMDMG